jgi:hypothetical protein
MKKIVLVLVLLLGILFCVNTAGAESSKNQKRDWDGCFWSVGCLVYYFFWAEEDESLWWLQ